MSLKKFKRNHMTILLLGGSGQLGRELIARAGSLSQSKNVATNGTNKKIVSPVSSELDVSNRAQIFRLVQTVKPTCIINSAAYTAVDKAEVDTEKAYAVNSDGPGYIAEAAREVGARLIHISTDYVFSGDVVADLGERRPYRETDAVEPISIYGKSKLAGEVACLEKWGEKSLVVRTSSLFGGKGPNFVLTMLKLFGSSGDVRVVSDQYMSPTWAGWLASVVLRLTESEETGIMHASCSGTTSWLEFAEAIFTTACERQKANNLFLSARVLPTVAAEYIRPAPRPMYSVMDCTKLSKCLSEPPMSWQDALAMYLAEFKELPF
jgi:dTDP-4-dehydrorhamnose reductase